MCRSARCGRLARARSWNAKDYSDLDLAIIGDGAVAAWSPRSPQGSLRGVSPAHAGGRGRLARHRGRLPRGDQVGLRDGAGGERTTGVGSINDGSHTTGRDNVRNLSHSRSNVLACPEHRVRAERQAGHKDIPTYGRYTWSDEVHTADHLDESVSCSKDCTFSSARTGQPSRPPSIDSVPPVGRGPVGWVNQPRPCRVRGAMTGDETTVPLLRYCRTVNQSDFVSIAAGLSKQTTGSQTNLTQA